MSRLLIVDPDPFVTRSLSRLLERAGHRVDGVETVQEGRAVLARTAVDLMLCDVTAARGAGMALLEDTARLHPQCALVLVASHGFDDLQTPDSTLDLAGFLVKPIHPLQLQVTVANALRLRALELQTLHSLEESTLTADDDDGATAAASLPALLQAGEDARHSQEETILRLSRAAEFRDDETGQHVRRMSHYCALLARRCGLGAERAERLRIASPLHDVGKIGIPDQILFKPGRLDHDEFDHMKRHTIIGHRILAGSRSDLLQLAASVALTHHENVDGTGYPRGLHAEEIPLEGRLCAVADVFDALTSRRVYKEAMPVDQAIELMRAERGIKFDPPIFDAFTDALTDVLAIKARYTDGKTPPVAPAGGPT